MVDNVSVNAELSTLANGESVDVGVFISMIKSAYFAIVSASLSA